MPAITYDENTFDRTIHYDKLHKLDLNEIKSLVGDVFLYTTDLEYQINYFDFLKEFGHHTKPPTPKFERYFLEKLFDECLNRGISKSLERCKKYMEKIDKTLYHELLVFNREIRPHIIHKFRSEYPWIMILMRLSELRQTHIQIEEKNKEWQTISIEEYRKKMISNNGEAISSDLDRLLSYLNLLKHLNEKVRDKLIIPEENTTAKGISNFFKLATSENYNIPKPRTTTSTRDIIGGDIRIKLDKSFIPKRELDHIQENSSQ